MSLEESKPPQTPLGLVPALNRAMYGEPPKPKPPSVSERARALVALWLAAALCFAVALGCYALWQAVT